MLFTGPKAELNAYIEQVHAMYASRDLYVVKWKEWFSTLLNGVLVAVHKPQDEDDIDGDLVQEEDTTKGEHTPQRETRGGVGIRGRGGGKENKKKEKEGQ